MKLHIIILILWQLLHRHPFDGSLSRSLSLALPFMLGNGHVEYESEESLSQVLDSRNMTLLVEHARQFRSRHHDM